MRVKQDGYEVRDAWCETCGTDYIEVFNPEHRYWASNSKHNCIESLREKIEKLEEKLTEVNDKCSCLERNSTPYYYD